MTRSAAFRFLARCAATAAWCDRTGQSEVEAVEQRRAQARSEQAQREQRRRLLQGAAGGAALVALGATAPKLHAQAAADVAVVGAGFAGLQAASALAGKRIDAQVYEAGSRVGGRVWSLRGAFPGQVVERGAELIDTTHSTVRGLANAFGLTLESHEKQPGEEFFHFMGRHWSEAEVVAEYRAFSAAMNNDLRSLSGGPTADSFNAYDAQLDRLPLSDYLSSRGAGTLLRGVMDTAYTIEFGRQIDRQSSLALLFFAQANKRGHFTPFGNFSDERFHIVEGNDAIATGLERGLPRPVHFGHQLLRVARLADGRLKLALAKDNKTVEVVHAAVILALPAPMMRSIAFDASVGLPSHSRSAIDGLDYGTNSKMMIGFTGRPWQDLGSNGGSYSDLRNHQNTWETSPETALAGVRGVITDYSGGERGARLDPGRLEAEASAFLADLDVVWPGSIGQVRRDAQGRAVAHLENWSRNPLFRGAYTNNQPGYFTTLEGQYAKPAGERLFFAGEHTDSFYSYQGFMEGALLSGARAADQVWRTLR
ncbi:flavin monoamine oxidase family protein [Aquabacterium sp.]|uniref:flavin monoamine oxidase family protein n=1 Tax=Aquabacterium sp. TaxID=1872578 RepID=UPI002C0EF613|nr:NAD(P)/FAD-dependent oxidoreductase [Aquabacterium sp.]HSW08529.1 NAD(P)/FAD-dependent oxidoreductase [Aquabacterium sp.]